MIHCDTVSLMSDGREGPRTTHGYGKCLLRMVGDSRFGISGTLLRAGIDFSVRPYGSIYVYEINSADIPSIAAVLRFAGFNLIGFDEE